MSTVSSCAVNEIQLQLKSVMSLEKNKKALAKAIACADTIGNSAPKLFRKILVCMHAGDLELKKLAQLYLVRHAPEFPDVAVMSINTLVLDCSSSEPFVRARALRTMGYLKLAMLPDHLGEPLSKALHDNNDYVRKTAAICVAKLHSMSPAAVEQFGLLDQLKVLLEDRNPMVVVSALVVLSELSPAPELVHERVEKLLKLLDNCNEWGRVCILDTLSSYVPVSAAEARTICEIISPHLAHKNSAVVVSVARILMNLLEVVDPDFVTAVEEKLSGPMVAFLSSEPEIKFAVLQEIQKIVRNRPHIFRNRLKSFFVNYNDPVYVKLLKLDVISHLVCAANISLVLTELKSYLFEIDDEFVCADVRAIGKCAVVVESCSLTCLRILKVVALREDGCHSQEAIITVQTILHAYRGQHADIVAVICGNLPPLTRPEAKAAAVWMVGEYAEEVEDAMEILDEFLEGFLLESPLVQLQLLTAVVKLFLKKPDTSQTLVIQALNMCTTEVENPDVRERGFFYKRLLLFGDEMAKQVVLQECTPNEVKVERLLDLEYTQLL